MYTAPTEDDFAIINSFWDFRIENGDEEVGLHQMLLPYSIIAYNTHQVELKKRIFDFKMTANSNMVTVMHFNVASSHHFQSRNYEETLTILAIRKIIKHAKLLGAETLFFHSTHEFLIESMFTVGFEKYTAVQVAEGVTSVCAQLTI